MTKELRRELAKIAKTVDNVNSDEEVRDIKETVKDTLVTIEGIGKDIEVDYRTERPDILDQNHLQQMELSPSLSREISESVKEEFYEKHHPDTKMKTNVQRIMPPNRALLAVYYEESAEKVKEREDDN